MPYTTSNIRKTFDEFTHGVLTGPAVYTLVQQILDDQHFYELEPAEVIEVAIEESQLPVDNSGKPDYSFLGAIKARLLYSQHNISQEHLSWVKPLDDTAIGYPIEGEYVIVGIYLKSPYYISKINILSGINNNSAPGLSSTVPPEIPENFSEDTNIRKLHPRVGDSIYQGRYGNSIRFSKHPDTNLPTILIRAGQLDGEEAGPSVTEDINLDTSSIWITSGGEVNLNPGYPSSIITEFDKKQIIINSDNIIFNTKNGGDIALLSNRNVIIGSTIKTVIESPAIKLGSDKASESLVLGNTLLSILNELLTSLQSMTVITIPAGGPSSVPVNIAQFIKIQAKLSTILSKQNTTI